MTSAIDRRTGRRRTTLLAQARWAFLAVAALAAAEPAKAQTQKFASVEGVTEYRLSNGLRVLLLPDSSKPIVTVNITYLVGSRHEGVGEKGMAHLLEHMLFKGTPTRANIWGSLQDHGAEFNGSTTVDRTNYYEVLPASDENLAFALELEADRMVNSKVAAEDLKSEMTVVRNEFEIGENDPEGVLSERMLGSAYLWHNYGQSTIGNKSDIERVPIESLRSFYKRYYRPDNAVLIVAGKFDADKTLKRVEALFGGIARPADSLRVTYTIEPPQDGERNVALRRVGDVAVVGAMYHIPAGAHPDVAALDVLDSVLTAEPTGRLYAGLVKSQIAVSVSSNVYSWAEPGVIEIAAKVRSDRDPEPALKTLVELTEGVARAKITDEEVDRGKTQLLSDIDVRLRDSSKVAILLSEFAAMGDWRLLYVIRDRYKAVTTNDVVRVAEKYLVSTNRTTGIFYPTQAPARSVVPDAPAIADIIAGYKPKSAVDQGENFVATPENIEKRTVRFEVAPGIRAAVLPKKTRGKTVHLELVLHYGDEASLNGKRTAAELLPSLMERGTQSLSFDKIKDRLAKAKSKISLGAAAPGKLTASVLTDRDHLAATIDLLAEMLENPSFPEDQFKILVKEGLARYEAMKSEPLALGMTQLRRALAPLPKDNIRYVPTIEEEIERIKAVSLEDIKMLHSKYLGASHVEAAAAGDFDVEELKSLLAAKFGRWKSPAPYTRIAEPFVATDPIDATIETPDKANAVIGVGAGFPLRKADPEYPAVSLANFILGSSPKSRLLTELRHKGGLSYGAGSQVAAGELDKNAVLIGFAMCNPKNTPKAYDLMMSELHKWIETGVTADELKDFRGGYLQTFKTELADDGFIADALVTHLESGETFLDTAKRLAKVESLTVEETNATIAKIFKDVKFARVRAGDFAKPAK